MFKKIGIVGFGQMGSGIAQVSAAAGYPTLAMDMSSKCSNAARIYHQIFDGQSKKGKRSSREESSRISRRHQEFADCDIIIEAVVENIESNSRFKTRYSLQSGTILASLHCQSVMAWVTNRRDRFVGLHFFNPVPVMKLQQ
jgi:3-hydroxybutyryl-CoA dehydrogenase